jgi:hypothetical protein
MATWARVGGAVRPWTGEESGSRPGRGSFVYGWPKGEAEQKANEEAECNCGHDGTMRGCLGIRKTVGGDGSHRLARVGLFPSRSRKGRLPGNRAALASRTERFAWLIRGAHDVYRLLTAPWQAWHDPGSTRTPASAIHPVGIPLAFRGRCPMGDEMRAAPSWQ